MDLTAPAPNELEISVFGPGYGECIVVHLGDGRWMVIDSLLDINNRPVALSYLEQIGVSPDNVALIVASHWDDDHIRGLAELANTCPNAPVFISSALKTDEFAAFAQMQAHFGTSRIPSGVRELIRVVNAVEKNSARKRLASVDKLLLSYHKKETSFGESIAISALSPGDGDVAEFLERLAEYTFSTDEMPVSRPMPFSKNDASVVVLASVGDIHLLLGADLENRTSHGRGWNGVLACQTVRGKKAGVFKVSHHGSENAYDADVWKNLLESEAHAVIAPWRLGSGALPKLGDVERILSHTSNLYITALPSGGKPPPRGNIVQSEMRSAGIKVTATYKRLGQVRLRRVIGSTDPWQVALLEPACSGDTYAKHLKAA